jgi:hypothetical protein
MRLASLIHRFSLDDKGFHSTTRAVNSLGEGIFAGLVGIFAQFEFSHANLE